MDLPPLVRRVAWVQIAFGGIGLAVVGFLLVVLAVAPDRGRFAPEVLLPTLLLLTFAVLLPAVLAGNLLLRGNRWAPLAVSIAARSQLFAVPIGTAVGAWTMWAVWRATRVPTPEPLPDVNPYAWPPPRMAAPPRPVAAPQLELLPESKRVAPLLAVFVAVGVLFAGVVALGFWISGDALPADVDDILIPTAVLLTTVATIAWRGMRQNHERASRGG